MRLLADGRRTCSRRARCQAPERQGICKSALRLHSATTAKRCRRRGRRQVRFLLTVFPVLGRKLCDDETRGTDGDVDPLRDVM